MNIGILSFEPMKKTLKRVARLMDSWMFWGLAVFFFLFLNTGVVADEIEKDIEISITDSISYAYLAENLLKEGEYEMFFVLIRDHCNQHWSTNLLLINQISQTDIVKQKPNYWGNIKVLEGNIWNSTDERDKAYQSYMEANRIFETTGNEKGKALVLLNLSHVISADMENIDPAKNMLLTAAGIFKKYNDSINTFKCYNNISVQYLNRKISDSVVYYLEKAKAYNTSDKSGFLGATITLNLGEYYMLINDLEASDSCYLKANEVLTQLQHHDALTFSYSQLGVNALKTNSSLAISYFDKALEYSKKANEKLIRLEVLEHLGKLHLELNDHKKSSHFFLEAIDLGNYLKTTELKEKEELMKLHMEVNDKLKHISSLSTEKKILERNTRFISISAMVLVTMGLIIIFLLRGQIRKKKTLILQNKELSESQQLLMETKLENERLQKELIEEDLSSKSNQVSSFAMQLVKKNEFIQRLQKEIMILRKKVKNDAVLNEIQQIIVNISQNIDTENNLLEFNMQVNKANQVFYSMLDQQFPDLTKTEKQILGFLKIDMTSKEIASILNISLQGVNTKRYRLRKKLGMENSMSFEEFFDELCQSKS